MPTILIAVAAEQQRHLERSFFWRSDMRRTLAAPGELLSVARTLGPDVIIVTPEGPAADPSLDRNATRR